MLESGDYEGALESLQAKRARNPDSLEVRIDLGKVYYQMARDALDRQRNETLYLANLERAVDEFVTAVELAPAAWDPHFYLAMIDLYRGDTLGMVRGFQNCRRLRPGGVGDTNLGEAFVYRGDLDKAREWTSRGARSGGVPGAVEFNRMLISWKAGDLRDAEERFHLLRQHYPQMLSTINEARLPIAPRKFEKFASYCCGSPGCGPYIKEGCAQLGLAVNERVISEEAILKDLRIEIERTRRLRKVYEQRKDLEIEVGDPEEE